jgi:hypothetical protein
LINVFTCTALVKTMRDNSIPLGTPVIELLPDLAPGWRADVRLAIEQILGQVSGLRESVDSTALAALGDGPRALQDAAELVVGTGNEHEPGACWSSCNGNYILAGAVLAAPVALRTRGRWRRHCLARGMLYGPGWALGPSGQMCLNGRLPGYRPAMLLIPDEDYVSVVVTNQQHALRAAARFLSDMQHPLTNDDLASAIDRYAA